MENNSGEKACVCVCVQGGLISERLPGEGGCSRKTTKLPISKSLEKRNPFKPLISADSMKEINKEKGMTEIKKEWSTNWMNKRNKRVKR